MVSENTAEFMRTLVKAEWATGTGGTRPGCVLQWEAKQIRGDKLVFLHYADSTKEKFDLFYAAEAHKSFVMVRIATYESETRYNTIYTELERIRKAKRKDPTTVSPFASPGWQAIHFVGHKVNHVKGIYQGNVMYRLETGMEVIA